MGLLDMFSKKGPGALKKHASRVANKRAQAPDRWESIQALAAMNNAEAVEALLQRFTFRIDPSITDQEEKDVAFEGIVAAGDAAVQPLRAFLAETDSIGWPLKMLERLLPEPAVVAELLKLLATMDTEYARDPEKKIQAIAYLEEHEDPEIVTAVMPFLDDTNDEVRFHAVGAIFRQPDPLAAHGAFLAAYGKEESVRVRARILDGFRAREWGLGDRHQEWKSLLPAGYTTDAKGMIKKAG